MNYLEAMAQGIAPTMDGFASRYMYFTTCKGEYVMSYRASSRCSWAISCWKAAFMACFSAGGRKL